MECCIVRATATVSAVSLCALARARVPHECECALAFALAVRAGREIGPDGDAMCRECGTWWSMAPPWQTWLRSWDGEPLCADCAGELELDAELKGFAELTADLESAVRKFG